MSIAKAFLPTGRASGCHTNNKRTKVVMTLVLSCFVLEFTPYGETAAEKVGVHPILVWWRRRELNPCPKAFSRDFLRAQSFN